MALTAAVTEFLAVLKRSGHVPTDLQPTAQAARDESVQRRARLMIEAPHMDQIEDLHIPGAQAKLTVRLYTPARATRSGATIVWLHGGGWVLGDIEAAHAESARIAAESGAVLVSVDYRLAPEHRFPAAVEDSTAALAWAADHIAELGGDASRLFVGGISSGGNLAAIAAQRAIKGGGPALAGQILIVPVLDLRFATDSWQRLPDGYLLTRATCEWYLSHYLGAAERREDPALSPGLAADADLVGLAPTLMITAEYDPLRDEDLSYVARLREAQVAVEHLDYAGVIHGFLGQLGKIPESEAAFSQIGRFVRETVATKDAGVARHGSSDR